MAVVNFGYITVSSPSIPRQPLLMYLHTDRRWISDNLVNSCSVEHLTAIFKPHLALPVLLELRLVGLSTGIEMSTLGTGWGYGTVSVPGKCYLHLVSGIKDVNVLQHMEDPPYIRESLLPPNPNALQSQRVTLAQRILEGGNCEC